MTLPFTLPEREGGPLAVGEFAPGAGSKCFMHPDESQPAPFTLPEREGGPLAVGEFAPGAGLKCFMRPDESQPAPLYPP